MNAKISITDVRNEEMNLFPQEYYGNIFEKQKGISCWYSYEEEVKKASENSGQEELSALTLKEPKEITFWKYSCSPLI